MILRISVTILMIFHATFASAERLDIPESTSQRILALGKVLASWPVDGVGAVNFARLFYVHSAGAIYLCRVEERNSDIVTNCFARSAVQSN